MRLKRKELAEYYEVTEQTVTNWVNSDPPCPSLGSGHARRFDTAAVAEWHAAKAVREAIARLQKQPPTDEADARKRKLMAEAILAEIQVREKEGELVPADIVEDVVGQLSDRMRAVCINAPSSYALDLERAGVASAAAHEILEKLADDLTRALRGVVDLALDDDEPDEAA